MVSVALTYSRSIREMDNGEVVLLENLRFSSEELLKAPAYDLAKTHLVKKLSLVSDLYLNDAFGTAHRAQASIVAFPLVLTSGAGKLMEKEVERTHQSPYDVTKTEDFYARGGKGR